MFETATLSYGPASKKVWTTAAGFAGQAALVACLVLVPLVSPAKIGKGFIMTMLVAPSVPPGHVQQEQARVVPRPPDGTVREYRGFREPTVVPVGVARVVNAPPEIADPGPGTGPFVEGGERPPVGARGNCLACVLTTAVATLPPAKPVESNHRAAVAPVEPPKPVRVTALRMATPIYKVDPVYPQLAKQARVSGTVELLGVLGTDGRIHELRVLKGHPLLVNAAVEAVKQWIYRPTELNGQAVEVSAPVTVTFILN
jgi:protein TonB